MTLLEVLNTLETELVAVVMEAWATTRVHTSPPPLPSEVHDLPEAYVFLFSAEPSDEGEGSLCSESAWVPVQIYLHAETLESSQLAKTKREKAQNLRDALVAADLTTCSYLRWAGDDYNEPEDAPFQIVEDTHLVRVRFNAFVEWDS